MFPLVKWVKSCVPWYAQWTWLYLSRSKHLRCPPKERCPCSNPQSLIVPVYWSTVVFIQSKHGVKNYGKWPDISPTKRFISAFYSDYNQAVYRSLWVVHNLQHQGIMFCTLKSFSFVTLNFDIPVSDYNQSTINSYQGLYYIIFNNQAIHFLHLVSKWGYSTELYCFQ